MSRQPPCSKRGPVRLPLSLSASVKPLVLASLESTIGRNEGMSLSQLARSINESPTLKLNETAALLREKGEPVIHLGGGEPKSKTPMDAILSCTALLNTGDVKYSPADGIPALEEGHHPVYRGALRAEGGSGERHRIERRQAIDHGAAARDSRPQGRGGVSGPVLGELSRDGEAGGRGSGGGEAQGRHVSAHHRGHRRSGGLLHQGDHSEQPEQPQRRGLLEGVDRPDRGVLREEEPLPDHGRHLQPSDLRRPDAEQLLRIRQGPDARARSWWSSTASRRCTP